MNEENKFLKAVARLIQLTQEEALRWKVEQDTKAITYGTESIVDLAYVATQDGQPVRLYELKYKAAMDEYEFNWESEAVLELVDEQGYSAWRFPNSKAIWDLLEAVRYQTSGVDQFIDRLLTHTGGGTNFDANGT